MWPGRNLTTSQIRASIFFSKRPKVPLPPRGRVRAIPSRARAGRVSRRILARGRTYRHPRSAGAARRARTARETTPVLFGGGDGVSVTLNRAFDAGQRTKRTPIFGAAMSGPETPARVKKETAKVRSRVRRGEHMTETTSCHGREVSPRRTPAPGSLAIAERFHDGFGTPETPVRVVTLAPRPGRLAVPTEMPLTVDVFPTLHARADARLHEARREHLRRAGRGEAPVERRLRETEAGERDELETLK